MAKAPTPPREYHAKWLENIDQRTSIGQELRHRHTSLCNDLGGASSLSYQQKALINRALFLEYWLEQQEQALANGADFDAGRHTQAVNALSGLMSKLGLQRVAREVSLGSILEERAKK